jgi:hypothetical protein
VPHRARVLLSSFATASGSSFRTGCR